MRIESTVATYAQNAGVTGNSQDTKTMHPASATASTATVPVQSTSVSISGKAIMLSRLFRSNAPNATPPVMSGVHGMDIGNGTLSVYYLTESDRTLVSDMYAYAQQQGADPQYVDTLALTLSEYRQHDNGRLAGGFNGNEFDSQGHQLTSSYSPADTATATRILNGDAINSTRLDHGFLNHILNPTNALSNASNMGFMEQMVVKFSDKGTANMSLDPKFSTYSGYDSAVRNVVITASKGIMNPNPSATWVADYTSVNGVGHWRTPELAAAASQGSTGKSAAGLNEKIVNSLSGNNQAASKNNSLSRLLDLMSFGTTTKRIDSGDDGNR